VGPFPQIVRRIAYNGVKEGGIPPTIFFNRGRHLFAAGKGLLGSKSRIIDIGTDREIPESRDQGAAKPTEGIKGEGVGMKAGHVEEEKGVGSIKRGRTQGLFCFKGKVPFNRFLPAAGGYFLA